jgi:hypothetical protein
MLNKCERKISLNFRNSKLNRPEEREREGEIKREGVRYLDIY